MYKLNNMIYFNEFYKIYARMSLCNITADSIM